MTSARIRALTRPTNRLQKMADNLIGEVIAVMDTQIDTALDILRTEPPPKVGSDYVRTHTYQRGWERSDVRLIGTGLVGTISNDAIDPKGRAYSRLVGGDEAGTGQLPMHRDTGWPLMAVALREGVVGGITFRERVRKAVHDAAHKG